MRRLNKDKTIRCFSCNAEVPDLTGEVHRYMGSSPGCWHLFGEILAREYSDGTYRKNHRITVDTYAVQHFGKPSPQAIQSVNLHLSSLYLIYELGWDVRLADRALTILVKYKTEFGWLKPPSQVGSLTVADVIGSYENSLGCVLILTV